MGADNMVTIMERAMEAGHSVLIENMGETIDAVLNPVITRCVQPQCTLRMHTPRGTVRVAVV
jgi:hypothetical protein